VNNKENQDVNVRKSVSAAAALKKEDQALQTLIESILELYPEIRLKAKRAENLREIIG